jgi:hypothetical protein
MSANRAPVSDTLGVLSQNLLMFHALYALRDRLHYIDDLDVIVALRREGARLTVHDVVGTRTPRFDELFPYITSPDISEVVFDFVPDKLGVDNPRWRPLQENSLHDRHDFPLHGKRFLFPFTAHA